MKKPAYSKTFEPMECDSFKVAIIFYGSDAWRGKDSPMFSNHCLVIPPNENPLNFDLSALRGCLVYGKEQGASHELYRKDLAIACLIGGAVLFRTFAISDCIFNEEAYGHAA